MAVSGGGRVPFNLLIAVAVLALLSGCGAPPKICGACDSTLEAQSSYHNVYVSSQSSSVTIQLYRNGSARWEITNNLTGEGVTALRENQSLATEIVRDSLEGWRTPTEQQRYRNGKSDLSNINTSFEGRAFHVRFWLHRMGEPGARDMLLVDELHHAHSPYLSVGSGYRVNSERVTIHAPPEMVVVNNPPGASVNESTVQWSGNLISKQTYLVFSDERSSTERMQADIFIAKTVFEWVWPSYLVNAFISVSVLGMFVISRLLQMKEITGRNILSAARAPLPMVAVVITLLVHIAVAIYSLKIAGLPLLVGLLLAAVLLIYGFVGASKWRLSTRLTSGILIVGAASVVSLTFALVGIQAQTFFTIAWLLLVVIFGIVPVTIYDLIGDLM